VPLALSADSTVAAVAPLGEHASRGATTLPGSGGLRQRHAATATPPRTPVACAYSTAACQGLLMAAPLDGAAATPLFAASPLAPPTSCNAATPPGGGQPHGRPVAASLAPSAATALPHPPHSDPEEAHAAVGAVGSFLAAADARATPSRPATMAAPPPPATARGSSAIVGP